MDHMQYNKTASSELRQDRTSGSWVIIAPQRAQRPQGPAATEEPRQRLRFDPSCPFCPGNEAKLPGIISEVEANDAPGWSVRVVPNKFPALRPDAPDIVHVDHQARPGRGVHEVIIESPWHDGELATMDAAALTSVTGAYRQRSRALLARDDIAATILFRNGGGRAGASLAHPHAQIIGLGVVPPRIAALGGWNRRYHDQHGRCALCDELGIEREDGARVVDDSPAFLAMVPYAADHPFEIWIVPKQHQPSFAELNDNLLGEFATVLRRSLRRLHAVLGDAAYNMVLDTAPKAERTAPHWHWKARVVPNVVVWGGFELGAALPINPSNPEDDARLLRATAQPDS
jgi:UDPglucose--hexose-1-phosphate uridylyltransferase